MLPFDGKIIGALYRAHDRKGIHGERIGQIIVVVGHRQRVADFNGDAEQVSARFNHALAGALRHPSLNQLHPVEGCFVRVRQAVQPGHSRVVLLGQQQHVRAVRRHDPVYAGKGAHCVHIGFRQAQRAHNAHVHHVRAVIIPVAGQAHIGRRRDNPDKETDAQRDNGEYGQKPADSLPKAAQYQFFIYSAAPPHSLSAHAHVTATTRSAPPEPGSR